MTVNEDLMRAFIVRFALSLAGLLVIDLGAIAQVVPDQTLLDPSIVKTSGSTTTINGGTTAGTNLFHSFAQFSVPSDSTAFFNNNSAISNIITRVTGAEFSQIDGLIKANGTANFFLINPNGILFGPNASLNIGGSFVASTANSFNFADGSQYSAIAPQTSALLSIKVPVGLQYGKVTQPINVVGSSLSVNPDKTLALVGGDISLNKAIFSSFDSRIELGGLAEAGIVELKFTGNTPILNFPTDTLRSNILISESILTVPGLKGGDIAVNAKNINVANSSLLTGIVIGSGNQAGDIRLNAQDNIVISKSVLLNELFEGSIGKGGDITVTAKTLSLTDSSQIDTNLSGQGTSGDINIGVNSLSLVSGSQIRTDNVGTNTGGDININALDNITLNGSDAQGNSSGILSSIDSNGQGSGGNIAISTKSLVLSSEGEIVSRTSGVGTAGNLVISADDSVVLEDETSSIFNGSASISGGNAGNISISTKSLELNNGASIVNATFGQGEAGDIFVSTQSLKLNNGATLINGALGQGNTGSIFINSSGAVELSGTDVNNSVSIIGITTGAESFGNGGDISVAAQSVKLNDGASIINATLGQGNSGNISIAAAHEITVDSSTSYGLGSSIAVFTGSDSSGNGGYINLSTGSLSLTKGGLLYAGSQGKGSTGDIIISASDFILLDGAGPLLNGGILNNPPLGAAGGAGNIFINTKSLSINNGAAIYALQSGAQTTGNINITATKSVTISGAQQSDVPSRIASATFTNLPSGDITINTPVLNIFGLGLGGLDQTGVTATSRGTGNAGDIAINADIVTVDGGEIASILEYNAIGDGGSITVTANTLKALNGGNIRTSSLSTSGGNAGDINFFLSDSLNLSGKSSGVFANTDINSTGKGGSIFIDPSIVKITDGAAISVDSQGSGAGGSIALKTDALQLDNATISATTASNDGGNISLGVQDLFLANNNSTISATAGGSGNGGNLGINTGFLILNNNSNITANAFQGQGGNIQIATQGLFQSRDSKITASSQLGINGTVQLNVTDLDPSRGLFSLPETVVDASGLVAQKCDAAVGKESQQSEFVVTGRGGLQHNPGESLQDESILSSWVTLQPHSTHSSEQAAVMITPSAQTTDTIAIAQGWKVDSDGTVILTAEPNSVTSASTWQPSVKCRA